MAFLAWRRRPCLWHGCDNKIRPIPCLCEWQSRPETITNYIESHDYGVATLGNEFLSQLPLGAQFILNPGEVSDQDLIAIAFVVPALLKAAALVRGIKNNPLEQTRILEHYLEQIIPGASPQGRSFIIQLAQYIQEVLINQKLVEVSA